jgi:hypothetical protein
MSVGPDAAQHGAAGGGAEAGGAGAAGHGAAAERAGARAAGRRRLGRCARARAARQPRHSPVSLLTCYLHIAHCTLHTHIYHTTFISTSTVNYRYLLTDIFKQIHFFIVFNLNA